MNEFVLFRILALEKLGAVFNQVAYNLDFTPRKFVVHPESGRAFIYFLNNGTSTTEMFY